MAEAETIIGIRDSKRCMVDVTPILGIATAVLGIALAVLAALFERKSASTYTEDELEAEIKKRLQQQAYSVKGAIGEQMAPHMKEFLEKYEPADARFLGGKPVDYLVYKGYNRVYNTPMPIDEVVFLEVKTSKYKERGPDRNEAKIRDAVLEGRVRYDVLTIHLDTDNPD